ncbi:MAG: hypothetical protein HZB10_01420 [Candidatus Yonathbacteria bacterium]|nr:hypothetical protein [Candidatus Yonathbacteria bacterium]
MESSELALYRGLGAVRNYGILVLLVLLVLNGVTLGALNWFETSDLRSELSALSEKIPAQTAGATRTEQTLNLPEDILSFHVANMERTGFYETRINEEEYLAYANPENNYILMKSEASIQHEVQNFALTLIALYAGEVVILLGWWLFVRAKVRELFEII